MIGGVLPIKTEGYNGYISVATGEPVYRVRGERYAALVEQLEKLQRQASKLGVDPVVYREIGRETVIEKQWDAMQVVSWDVSRTYVYITVAGGYPHLNGWHFAAKIEPTGAGNMIKTMPGEVIPEKYRDATNHCDHCQTDRFRLETFVIRHDDGRYAQVGRNCLAKYVGSSMTPERLARMAEFGESVRLLGDDDYQGGGGGLYEVGTLEFLTWVACIARTRGFLSRKQAEEKGGAPTGQSVFTLLTDATEFARYTKQGGEVPNERDARMALEAREYAQGLSGGSDFEHNLKVACTLDALDYRQIGTVAYAIEALRRAREKDTEERAPKPVTTHVGEVGKRQRFDGLTVVRVMDFPGQYGVRHMVRMLDAGGNTLVWWTGGDVSDLELAEEAGCTVNLVATVKEHGEYKGVPQTMLTRGKLA